MIRALAGLLLVSAAALAPSPESLSGQTGAPEPLELEEVLASVRSAYPPLLAARIERDVADGKLRAARGVFDLQLAGKAGGTVDGYYEYTGYEAGLEQFLGLWGSTLYGGYRLTTGEELPDYYRNRTQQDGELSFGLRIPLLQGGPLDDRRAAVDQARVQRRAVEPAVARQRLDFERAGAVAYHRWVASGRKRVLSVELLELAQDRTTGLEQQVADGLRADIDLVDNQRLVVDREIGLLEAERDYRAAAVTLSLFLRDATGAPVVPEAERLPPELSAPDTVILDVEDDLERALRVRPELAILALEVASREISVRLAENRLLPTLDANVGVSRDLGSELYGNLARSELEAAVELKLPLQRREASGERRVARSELEQARQGLRFATEEVVAEIRVLAAEADAAQELARRAEVNQALAEELRAAEAARFQAGASDLLALQLRERAAFEADATVVDSRLALLVALAEYRAAVAEGVERFEDP